MNKEKLEKLKKSLDNKFIPENMKDKIRVEIQKLESQIKTDETITPAEVKVEVKAIEEKVLETEETALETDIKKQKSKKKTGRTVMAVAKEIRKEGESWKDAQARAKKIIADETKTTEKEIESQLSKLSNVVKRKKELEKEFKKHFGSNKPAQAKDFQGLRRLIKKRKDLEGISDSNLMRDGHRHAMPAGKRTSANGNVYYENRRNRTDKGKVGSLYLAGGGEIDSDAVSDLQLFIENDGNLYRQQIQPIQKNLILKMAKGDYNHAMAQKLFMYLVQNGDKKYQQEFGKSSTPYMLNMASRKELARIFEEEFYDNAKSGEYNYLLPKKYENAKFDKGGNVNVDTKNEPIDLSDDKKLRVRPAVGQRKLSQREWMGKNNESRESLAYELGGNVIPNLDGTMGGRFTTGDASMLDGFSGTNYTGLVGETGALSSGEMFEDGGMMPNQQVIDDASKGYSNYYLGEGTAQGIYKRGGAIRNQYKGRTAEDVWNNWTTTQRQHFLDDHLTVNQFDYLKSKGIDASKLSFDKLNGNIINLLAQHINMGEYADGGYMDGVIPNVNFAKGGSINDYVLIEGITKYDGSKVTFLVNKKELNKIPYENLELKAKAFVDEFTDYYGENSYYYKGLITNKKLINDYAKGYNHSNYKVNLSDDEENHPEGFYITKTKEYLKFSNGGYTDGVIPNVSFADGGGVELKGNQSKIDMNHNGKIDAEDFKIMRNTMNGAWRNERKHVNHEQDYEVSYARKKPSRTGYKGKRNFAGGSVIGETPKIYVANLEAYNNGRLIGEWLDLADYNDADELMDAIQSLLDDWGVEEYAIHDAEYIPNNMYSEYMGRKDFEELYEMIDLAKGHNLPLEVVQEVVSQYGESAVDEYIGEYDDEEDFAYQQVEQMGLESFRSPEYYIYITDTDRRIIAREEADNYVNDIRDEDGGERLISEADMDLDEYRDADSETQEEMLDEAQENFSENIYNEIYESLDDPYNYFVEERGLYSPEDFFKSNFISIDYKKIADDLEQDYAMINYEGKVYVFNVR